MVRKLMLLAALFGLAAPLAAEEKKPAVKKPKVEVVFALDTTGNHGKVLACRTDSGGRRGIY